MKLRTKALLIVGSSLTGLSVFVFSLVGIHTYGSYRKLEQQFVRDEVARIEDILRREISQLDRVATDYANWDETYNYMEQPNREYISANYEAETLTNLQLNRISLINKSQKIIFDRWFNYTELQQVRQTFPELKLNSSQSGIAICRNNQIFILSIHPILPSDKRGESRGWLMMARLIDRYKLEKISREARVKVNLYISGIDDLKPQVSHALQLDDFTMTPIDGHKIAGYTTIDNLEGRPQLILEVISSRYIYQQFVVGIQFLGMAIFTIGISATVIILILLDRLFLVRLSQLDDQIQSIKLNPNLIPYFQLSGKDELTDFSKAINEMLKVIEEARIVTATNKIKRDFMSVMSHELRTPMNAVLGMAQLLQLTQLDAEQQEYTQTIVESGNSLLKLLSDILDYIKLESCNLSNRNYSIKSILNDIKDKYQYQAKSKGLDLDFISDTEIPTTILIDAVKLQDILDRLVQNAIKFTNQGGVTVRVKSYPIVNGKHSLIFTVTDTGVGINPEDLDRIFQPFTMGDNSSTRIHGGTGMGLAIVQRLCQVLGATITVESELHKGTIFTISLVVEEESLNLISQGS